MLLRPNYPVPTPVKPFSLIILLLLVLLHMCHSPHLRRPPTPGACMWIGSRLRMSGCHNRCRQDIFSFLLAFSFHPFIFFKSHVPVDFLFSATCPMLPRYDPPNLRLQRAMAAEAEATRDARAKVGRISLTVFISRNTVGTSKLFTDLQ